MDNFRSTFAFCGLHELESRGPMCTWHNGQEAENFTMEKLDRVVANYEWLARFPKVEVSINAAVFSYHLPISISVYGDMNLRRQGQGFRNEAKWAKNQECKAVIKKIWQVKGNSHGTWGSVNGKLTATRKGLKEWQKMHARHVGQKLQKLSSDLLTAQASSDASVNSLFHRLRAELAQTQTEDDMYWRQRAKEDWLRFGDQNSRYFHACASQKKKSSMLMYITDTQGRKWETQTSIGDAFVRYFQELFTARGPRNLEPILEHKDAQVTQAINDSLLKEFTVDEVGRALMQMDPLKAPGRMGSPLVFSKKTGRPLEERLAEL